MCEEELLGGEKNSGEFTAKHLPCRDKPAVTRSHIKTLFKAFYCFTQLKQCPLWMGREELEGHGMTDLCPQAASRSPCSSWEPTVELCRAEWDQVWAMLGSLRPEQSHCGASKAAGTRGSTEESELKALARSAPRPGPRGAALQGEKTCTSLEAPQPLPVGCQFPMSVLSGGC